MNLLSIIIDRSILTFMAIHAKIVSSFSYEGVHCKIIDGRFIIISSSVFMLLQKTQFCAKLVIIGAREKGLELR